MTNLYTQLINHFPEDRSQIVIESLEGEKWSYLVLEQQTARFANTLTRLGVKKGDRVAALVDKSPQALSLYLACLQTGAIYLPLNTAYQLPEIDYFFADAKPRVVICLPELREAISELAIRHGVRQVLTLDEQGMGTLTSEAKTENPTFETVPCQDNDIAAILYTSGTTDKPKGAMLTHENLFSNALILREAWQWTSSDVLLHALPLFHVHGLFVACHCALLSGAKMFLLPKFDTRSVLDYLPRSTVFMGVPTYYSRLVGEEGLSADVCRSMRLFVSGSAPLPENVFYAFRDLSGHTILERYGMTETLMNTSNPYEGPRKPSSVGPALPYVGVRVVNRTGPEGIGNIQIKGPNVFKGYWRLPEKTAQEFTPDGWFETGDLGTIDEDGYLFISGRGKDLIITGGYNVYPREIERVLEDLDGIRESAVIGIPDPDYGESVIAIVVLESNQKAITQERIIAALKKAIVNYKVPKQILFVDELPRNAMGKIQKNALRDRYSIS